MYATIKAEAKKKGMSVSRLESEAGLSRSSICKWDNSSPTLSSVEKVAIALDMGVTELIAMVKEDEAAQEVE